MEGFSLILFGVIMFTIIVLVLVGIILGAKSKLVASGNATISINNDPDKAMSVPIGGKLLNALAEQEIFLPSACGGGGTCGECKCVITEGGGDVLPTEKSKLNRKQIREKCEINLPGSCKK
jgi:Na+-transporting NADH:ubiquinone oxidoreductase subunit F